MTKVKVGMCIEEEEYAQRITCYLINHYNEQLELHIFSDRLELEAAVDDRLDVIIVDDGDNNILLSQRLSAPVIYLTEERIELGMCGELEEIEEEGVYFVEKYQDVGGIVDEILKRVGGEVRELKTDGSINGKTQIFAVYSLADNQYQLPFALTLDSILGENSKVLLVDFQENSGLSRIVDQECPHNLEELIVMAESERYSVNRINSCIGHMSKADFVYPISNSESLCEIDTTICNNLIKMICSELQYDMVILNLGARFKGFFDLLNRCQEVFLVQRQGGLSQWREYEFTEELLNKGYKSVVERIRVVEPPIITAPVTSFERLVEQWKWNEFGDVIRGLTQGACRAG